MTTDPRLTLELRLLGPVDVVDGNGTSRPVDGDPGKKAATWLGLRPNEFFSRETIAQELWPEKTLSKALNSLGQGLSSLRRTLEGFNSELPLRVGPPKKSQIGLFGITTDLTRFRHLRDVGRLAEASAVVRGAPLADTSRNAGMWVEVMQDTLRSELDDVLGTQAMRAMAAADYAQALQVNMRRIDLDPVREEAFGNAALCLERLDRASEGLALLRRLQLQSPLLAPELIEIKHILETRTNPMSSPLGRRIVMPPSVPSERYSPTHTFDGVRGFDSTFNELLSADIRRSHTYMFRGISSKYVPARLIHRGPGLDSAKIIMVDPAATEAIRLRAIDRSSNPKYAGQNLEQLADSLRDEIIRSLIALFDVRSLCTIDIALVSSTAVDRVEVMDDAVWVSLYHGERSAGQLFPETMRYSDAAVAYDQARVDCLRQFDLAGHRVQFRSLDAEDVLDDALVGIGATMTAEARSRLRAEGATFTSTFLGELTGEVNPWVA